MEIGAHSYVYLAIAAGIMGFSFWKPQFPKTLAGQMGIRSATGVRWFLLIYWIAVPVVIYRFLYLATAP